MVDILDEYRKAFEWSLQILFKYSQRVYQSLKREWNQKYAVNFPLRTIASY